ncbi:MAG: hypothetical protein M1814_004714 [Vezdaea aestivalis]|nr:MAG: hypothetical protein M1814_004714 [Vezdaea aestivalis]
MAHSRSLSTTEALKDPHFVSLKVLRQGLSYITRQSPVSNASNRLSRPSLVEHSVLPPLEAGGEPDILTQASLAYPSADPADSFQLSPLLSLPPGFGRVAIGETLSCIICANNELTAAETGKWLNAFRLSVDVVTPDKDPIPLLADEEVTPSVGPGESLERIIKFELTEEGTHELRVTIKYSETTIDKSEDSDNDLTERVRSFRKIYKFLSQPCLVTRTKVKQLPAVAAAGSTSPEQLKYVLEAQLENVGASMLVIESATFEAEPPFSSQSLNWDSPALKQTGILSPLLHPRQVLQVAFLLDGKSGGLKGQELVLGQLISRWRTTMGDPGQLKTGQLTVQA